MKNNILKDYAKRVFILLVGLSICAVSTVMNLESFLGSSPWNAFHQGISMSTGIQIGTISQLTGLFILTVDLLMKEPIGFGTISNMYFIGFLVNVINNHNLIPSTDHLYIRIIYLIVSIALQAFGTCIYMSANLGSGPRDSLMVGISKWMQNISIGWIRNSIEFLAAASAYLLGGSIHLGTIVHVILIGPCLQLCFKLLNYNPKMQRTESISMTISVLKGDLIPLYEYKKE